MDTNVHLNEFEISYSFLSLKINVFENRYMAVYYI